MPTNTLAPPDMPWLTGNMASPPNGLGPPLLNYAAPPDATSSQGADVFAGKAQQAWQWLQDQRAESVRQGLLDPNTGLPTQKGVVQGVGDTAQGVMMGTTAPGGVPPPGIVAYHGSPADFNRFDDRFIGTGEGAQMYGWGHYFGGVEETGLNYRNNLSGLPDIAVDGTPITKAMEDATKGKAEGDPTFDAWVMARNRADHAWNNYAEAVAPKAAQDLIGAEADNAALAAEKWRRLAADDPQGRYENYLYSGTPNPADRAQWTDLAQHQEQMSAELRKLASSDWNLKQPGHMYEVNIGADPDSMLQWDQTVGQHPAALRDKLLDMGYGDTDRGADVYSHLLRGPDGDVGALQRLQAAGIPGISYLDQGSRSAGTGTKNHVVFDPATIEILRKYGLAGLMLGVAPQQPERSNRRRANEFRSAKFCLSDATTRAVIHRPIGGLAERMKPPEVTS